MKIFLIKSSLYLIIVLLLLFSFLFWHDQHYGERALLKNSQTESNLFVIPSNQNYDLCILGSSNARVLSRHRNHERLESILDKSIINLAQGKGHGGVLKNYIYLSYFFKKNNQTKELLYFLVPPTMFSNSYDHMKMEIEPFKFDFFIHALKSGMDKTTLYNYVISKCSNNWEERDETEVMNRALKKIDEKKIEKNFQLLARYERERPAKFKEKLDQLRKILELAKAHNVPTKIIFQANLMPPLPHFNEVQLKLKELQKDFNFEIIDFTDKMREPQFFYDHAHLNTEGVVHLAQHHLKKIID